MQNNLETSSSSSVIKQTLLTVCISISYLCIGLVRGYSAPAIPSMIESHPTLLPDESIVSWVSSIPPFGAFFGSLVAFPLMHFIGRKYTVLLTSPISVLAWFLISTSDSWRFILAGRILSGFAAGLTIPSAQIYVSECVNPKIRGVLGSLPSFSMSTGILIAYIAGNFLEWQLLGWMCCGISAFLFIAVILLPESPVWLKTKKRFHDAERSANWLCLDGFKSHELIELKRIEKTLPKERPFSKESLMRREVLLPLGIGLTLLAIQQLSGIDSVIFFTVEIFKSSGSSLESHIATIVVGFVQVFCNFISLFIVDKAGRKPLLITSGAIMSLAMALMGASFHLKSTENVYFGYLPLVSLIIFMIGFSIGFGCIPFLLMGELFPTAQRSLLSSLAGSLNLLIMFTVIKTYHPLAMLITTAGTFWLYSIFCAVGVGFVIFCVPETKGKDLEAINKLFEKKTEIKDDSENVHQTNLGFVHSSTNIEANRTKY